MSLRGQNKQMKILMVKHSPCTQTIIQQMRPKEVSLAQGHKKQHSQNYIPQTANLERDILSWS